MDGAGQKASTNAWRWSMRGASACIHGARCSGVGARRDRARYTGGSCSPLASFRRGGRARARSELHGARRRSAAGGASRRSLTIQRTHATGSRLASTRGRSTRNRVLQRPRARGPSRARDDAARRFSRATRCRAARSCCSCPRIPALSRVVLDRRRLRPRAAPLHEVGGASGCGIERGSGSSTEWSCGTSTPARCRRRLETWCRRASPPASDLHAPRPWPSAIAGRPRWTA